MAAAVPYLIVGAIGLIGEWLLKPKSSAANNTQPSSMPAVNQALRGTPIFVNFGQVRVSAQLTWSKNWTATRMKGGGKGAAKGGGSGGMGSAKGAGSAGQGYDYAWDIIFNFGMVDTPVLVTKAWVGGDIVNPSTVEAWNTQLFDPTRFDPLVKGTAEISATETFFAPGFVTGDARLTTWPYFQSQEGLDCAWPTTCYIGFNQLALGQTPTVPQLSLELTPAIVSGEIAFFTPNPSVYANPITTPNSTTAEGTQPYMKDATGDLWSFSFDGAHNLIVHRITDGHEISVVAATLEADYTGISGRPYNGASDFPTTVIPCPGSPYLYVTWVNIQFPSNPDTIYAMLYQITDANTLTRVGSKRMWYTGFGLSNNYPSGRAAATLANGEIATISGGRSTNTNSYIVTLPAPATVTGSDVDTGVMAAEMDQRTVQITAVGTNFFTANSNGRGFVIGFAPDGSAYIYIPKGRCQYELAHTQNAYIQTQAGTYPNGFWIKVASGVPSVQNGFLNDAGSPMVPFADAQLTSTGAAGTFYDDWSSILVTADGTIILMRSYSDTPWASKLLAFDSAGNLLAQNSTAFSDTGTFGADENINNNVFLDTSNGNLWFQLDRANGGFQDRWHVLFGTFTETNGAGTPPYIIRRILTSAIFGFQTQSLFGFTITDSTIDNASYIDAVQKCVSEGVFIAVSYTSQDSLLTVLNDLLALYAGTLAEHGGKIYFDVFRATDVPLRTIDNNHLISDGDGVAPVTVTKGAVQDGFNSVQYQFQDRSIDYKQNQVTITDEVDIDINGTRNKVYPSKFVMTGSLASQVAERALWSNLFGRDNYDFKLGWKDSDLRPGNQVTLVDSFHPSLQKGVKVVINKLQEQARGVFTAQATRVFDNHLTAGHDYINTASVDPGINAIIETAGPCDFAAYELPQEFQGANGFMYFGYNQSTLVMGAQLFISKDLGANYILSQDVQPYSISGRLAVPLPLRGPGYMERGVELYLFPTSGFSVATPSFINNYTFDDATPAIRQQGLSTIIVGSEALAMEGLTLLAENHYRIDKLYRGWGGTPITAISSGAEWHEHVSGIFAYPISQDDIGTTLFYKVAAYNFAGRAYDISSIVPKSYTIRGLHWLPRAQTPLRTFISSAVSWTNSTEFKGQFIAVPSGGCDVTLAWPAASNTDGFGSGGAGAGGFGHFIADITSPTYRVDIRSVDGTGVSSFVANTGYFNYSVAQNSADFGGFAKNVIYQVTPFTVKGDGPTSSIRSLSLNW